MKRLSLSIAAVVALASPAIAQRSSASAPSVADVRASIAKAYERYIAAFAAADAVGVASVYDAEHGARLGDGGAVVQGREAIAADLARFIALTGPVAVSLHTSDVWLLDDRAYESGAWSYRFTPKGKTERTIGGRYVTVWLHEPDGSWKMGADLSVPPG